MKLISLFNSSSVKFHSPRGSVKLISLFNSSSVKFHSPRGSMKLISLVNWIEPQRMSERLTSSGLLTEQGREVGGRDWQGRKVGGRGWQGRAVGGRGWRGGGAGGISKDILRSIIDRWVQRQNDQTAGTFPQLSLSRSKGGEISKAFLSSKV